MVKSVMTQPEHSQQPFTSLQGNKTCISHLDTSHRQLSIISKDKFHDQLTLIQLTQSNKSIINDAKIKTKTPNYDDFKFNGWRKLSQIIHL